MCQHQYHHEGHRTYGANIPGFAQGAYFPGDEPGPRCHYTGGEPCTNPQGDTPTECAANTRTEWLCPECQKDDLDIALWKRDGGGYWCPECGDEWTAEELPRAYAALLGHLSEQRADIADAHQRARAEGDCLRDALERVRASLGVAV